MSLARNITSTSNYSRRPSLSQIPTVHSIHPVHSPSPFQIDISSSKYSNSSSSPNIPCSSLFPSNSFSAFYSISNTLPNSLSSLSTFGNISNVKNEGHHNYRQVLKYE
ncbi:9032_t:CDS:2 [Diversispora eburnea]|uniref:9032_t:CDS:1 n=1 Tax=Diversispora eburnea TaxID=1213867 RepID=A0A9N9BWR0_9GLOM|nr:9032_t:CDS:2 [Diversispora eburnea]